MAATTKRYRAISLETQYSGMVHPAALLELTIAPDETHWHETSLGRYLQSGRHYLSP